jgi:hypothetical protein
METITGKVERIKGDRKALSTGYDNWFSSNFKPIDESIKVGDMVKIVYTEKGDFKNIKSLELIKEDIPENEFKDSNNETLLKKQISDVVLDTIIMQSVQYSIEKNIDLDKASDEVIKVLNKLR